MKKLQYGILLAILPLVLAFTDPTIPSKPLSIIEDISTDQIQTTIYYSKHSFVLKDSLYFISTVPELGNEVWRTGDGTAELVFETIVGPESAPIKGFFGNQEHLYVVAEGSSGDMLYHISDHNTPVQTLDLSYEYDVETIQEYNGKIYGLVRDGSNGRSTLVEFAGADVIALSNSPDYSHSHIVNYDYFNGDIYFVRQGWGSIQLVKLSSGIQEIVFEGTGEITNLDVSANAVYFSFKGSSAIETQVMGFDGSSLTDNGGLSFISQNHWSYGDYYAVYGQKTSDDPYQLWVTNGNGLIQITNFNNTILEPSRMTETDDSLYFLAFDNNTLKLNRVHQETITEVVTTISYYDQPSSGSGFFTYNNMLYIVGLKGIDHEAKPGVWELNGETSRELIVLENGGKFELFNFKSDVYALLKPNIYPQSEVSLLNLTDSIGQAQTIGTYQVGRLEFVKAGHSAGNIYLEEINSATTSNWLSVISNGSLFKVAQAGVTGSSNPEQFARLGEHTYFMATDEMRGTAIWKSDGLSASVVEALDLAVPNRNAEKIISIDDRLLFIVKDVDTGYELWSSDGLHTKLLKNGLAELDIDNSYQGQGALYVVGKEDIQSSYRIYKVHSGVIEVVHEESLYPEIMGGKDDTLFFSTASNEIFNLWQVSNGAVKEINTSSIEFNNSPFNQVIFIQNEIYLSSCTSGSASSFLLYQLINGSSMKKVDTSEFSNIPCNWVKPYALDDKLVVIKHKHSATSLWSVENGVAIKISDEYVSADFGGTKIVDDQLFFSAVGIDEYYSKVHILSGTDITQTEILGANYWVTQQYNRLIAHQGSSGEYKIYKVNNDELILENSFLLTGGGRVLEVREFGDYLFFLVSNQKREDDVILMNKDGELTFFSDLYDFNFGDFNHTNMTYPIAMGHKKWLFMMACYYTTGCEPYSADLNQIPIPVINVGDVYLSGYQVILDGSDSYDKDGQIVSFEWQQIAGIDIELDLSDIQKPTFMAPGVEVEQVVTFKLVVTDDTGASDSTTKELTIKPNYPPVADIEAPESVNEGEMVTLDGSSSYDPNEGEQLSYMWEVVSGEQVTINNQNSAIAQFVAPSIDGDTSVTIGLTVTDGAGNTDSANVSIALKVVKKSEGSGGGGSVNGLLLFMLVSFILLRFGFYRR